MTPRILLSVPHMGGAQQSYVAEAFATNWLSTVGPNIEGFENEFAAHIGMPVILLKQTCSGRPGWRTASNPGTATLR